MNSITNKHVNIQKYLEILPDDIIEYIYQKITYSIPIEIIKDIKKIKKIKKFIEIIDKNPIEYGYSKLQDFLIVYYSVKDNNFTKYDIKNVPIELSDKLCDIIDNSERFNFTKKSMLRKINMNFMLKIPIKHLYYIFKSNRNYI